MVYSRIEAPGRARAEALVSELEGGHAVLYASGLAALWAALVFFSPTRIVMNAGYHGTLFAVCSQVPNLIYDCQMRPVEQADATTLNVCPRTGGPLFQQVWRGSCIVRRCWATAGRRPAVVGDTAKPVL